MSISTKRQSYVSTMPKHAVDLMSKLTGNIGLDIQRLYFIEIKPVGIIHIFSPVSTQAVGLSNPDLSAFTGRKLLCTGQFCCVGLVIDCRVDLYLSVCPAWIIQRRAVSLVLV